MDYNITISVRMPLALVQELDALSKNSKFTLPNFEKTFADRSDAIKSLLTVALFIEKNKKEFRDPKFVEDLNTMIKQEKYADWLNTLSHMQLLGFKELLDHRLNGRQIRLQA